MTGMEKEHINAESSHNAETFQSMGIEWTEIGFVEKEKKEISLLLY